MKHTIFLFLFICSAVSAETIEHNRVAFGTAISFFETADEKLVQSYGIDAEAEYAVGRGVYLGGRILQLFSNQFSANIDEALSGKTLELSGNLGFEHEIIGGLTGFTEVNIINSNSNFTHYQSLLDEEVSFRESLSGIAVLVGAAQRINTARFEFSVSKGISGDYLDDSPTLSGTFHIDSSKHKSFFSEATYSIVDGGLIFTGLIGFHF